MINKTFFALFILLNSAFVFVSANSALEGAGIMGLQLVMLHMVLKLGKRVNKEYKQSLVCAQ